MVLLNYGIREKRKTLQDRYTVIRIGFVISYCKFVYIIVKRFLKVKNIEYSEKEKLMVTSAFDGSIFAWDLCSPTENNLIHSRIFQMSGLMRTKLSPDCSKLLIATTNGYIIIIHDLNLASMATDMRTFKVIIY